MGPPEASRGTGRPARPQVSCRGRGPAGRRGLTGAMSITSNHQF